MYSPSYSTFLLSSSLHFLSLLLHSALSFPASDLSFFKCRPTHRKLHVGIGEFALRLVSRPGSNPWSRLSANVQVKHSNYLIKWTKETHHWLWIQALCKSGQCHQRLSERLSPPTLSWIIRHPPRTSRPTSSSQVWRIWRNEPSHFFSP